MELRKFEYGHGLAVMILAGELMGLSPALVNEAKRLLDEEPIHPMIATAMEKEAGRVNDLVRTDTDKLAQANFYAKRLKVQYGFVAPQN